MTNGLRKIYIRNALSILKGKRRSARRIDLVYRRLNQNMVQGGAVDFLANPFVSTALSILEALSGNYKIRQAIKLLKEAGEEAKPKKKRW